MKRLVAYFAIGLLHALGFRMLVNSADDYALRYTKSNAGATDPRTKRIIALALAVAWPLVYAWFVAEVVHVWWTGDGRRFAIERLFRRG